jgi:hypothetical protein
MAFGLRQHRINGLLICAAWRDIPEGVVLLVLIVLVKLYFPYKFRESESLKSFLANEKILNSGDNLSLRNI